MVHLETVLQLDGYEVTVYANMVRNLGVAKYTTLGKSKATGSEYGSSRLTMQLGGKSVGDTIAIKDVNI